VLRDALLASSRDRAIVALHAVALLGDHARIDTALDSLAATDPAQRANALEVIETVADRDLVRPLIALWEPERTHHPDPGWRAEVLDHPDARIRAMATWALARGPEDHPDEGGTMTETLTTLPTMERVLFLRRVPLFADLPPHDLLPIAEIATEHSFADADTIAEQGEPGDEMHIIVSGYVMVIIRESDGHQEVLAVRSAGDVIGEMAVVTGGVRMASLAARGDVRLLSIERRQFEAVLRERPETALALMRILCERLATLERGGAVPA
jgi:cyclic nucleotide-binding protein